jgi:hypothetical protein
MASRTALVLAVVLLLTASAQADAPLTQRFEDGAPAWTTTGMWHVQADPQTISVIPAIADQLVVLPDAGALPTAVDGSHVAWFGEAATGTYCGIDFADVKQTPQDGCTSTAVERGTLTSPGFSLNGVGAAYVIFRAWWEIESVRADIADQMRVEYSTDSGATWVAAGSLNPLDPAWGGKHQPFTDAGARASASWQSYAADISEAAGAPDVQVRFVFDSVDQLRNGFRGLLVDGVSVVDALGATITDPGGSTFTDAPPSLSVDHVKLTQDDDGSWLVSFEVISSHTSTHEVGADWEVHGHGGSTVATGHVTIPPGATKTTVETTVTGADAPYTTTIDNPSGGATIQPGGGSSSTPGGSLPQLTLSSVGAAPVGDGLVAVSIGMSVNPAATAPISADYTLIGSDGVVAATGTITIAPGSDTATVTVTVPSAHAPYTVALSNPRGGLLMPGSTTATTSPLGGTTAVGSSASSSSTTTGTGEQLVLGVRQGAAPLLARTFELSVLSGTIRYHEPGKAYEPLQSGSVLLPMGSVVDATNGHAVITVEIDTQHTLQQAELWEGKFGVFQVGIPAVTELRLAGGDYSVCVGTSRKRHARKSAGGSVRHLWANAKGRFRTKGRFASATVRGTKWLTEDLCLATRITVAEGIVSVRDFRRKKTTAVRAGNSVTVGALQSARYRKRRGVHGPKLSEVRPG